MIVRCLWSHIAATTLLIAVAAHASGQEASPSVPTTNPPAAVSGPPAQPFPAATTPPSGPKLPNPADAEGAKPAAKAAAAPPPLKDALSKDPKGPAPVSRESTPEIKKDPPAKPRDPLDSLVEEAIQVTSRRKLVAGQHTPWQVVHGILAQRWDLKLRQPGKEDVHGIEWITSGVYFDGMPLWEATAYGGRGHPFTRPYAFEGHPTQFMGYMTMADIPLDYEVKTPTKVITIRDIVNDAKMQVHQGVEITWTLWTLAHYEEPTAHWFNAAGEPWSIERLVKVQIEEPVTSGACGGCHGLFALAYARNMYISTLPPRAKLRGVWFEADQKIKRYIDEARSLQNQDGSFSTNHFRGPGYSDDFLTRITASGHELEWLMIALPQARLKEEWIRRAITSVATDLISNRHKEADCGPLFHGMHALVVYRQRTVPGYLVPQFNSHIKLAERGKKSPAPEKPVSASPPPSRDAASLPRPEFKPVLTAPVQTQPGPSASNAVPRVRK